MIESCRVYFNRPNPIFPSFFLLYYLVTDEHTGIQSLRVQTRFLKINKIITMHVFFNESETHLNILYKTYLYWYLSKIHLRIKYRYIVIMGESRTVFKDSIHVANTYLYRQILSKCVIHSLKIWRNRIERSLVIPNAQPRWVIKNAQKFV